MKINIINALCDLGLEIDGSSLAPKVIEKRIKNNKEINKIINCPCDCSNKSHDTKDLAKNYDRILKYTSNLYTTILKNNNKNFIITVGGDHSIAVSSALAANKRKDNIGIIWIDAHADYNTFDTTITGNIHGLPLATINGLNRKLSLFHDGKYIDPKKTVIIGYRSEEENKEAEMNNLKKAGVTYFTTEDLFREGIEKIAEKAILIASNNKTNQFHISYDCDFIDPEYAPGVSTSEQNGPDKDTALKILDLLLEDNKLLSSFDLVEFNPLKDIDNKTLDIAEEIVNKVCNKIKEI